MNNITSVYFYRWMNKMGLAAIAYDEKKVTEHAIFPHVRRPNDNNGRFL